MLLCFPSPRVSSRSSPRASQGGAVPIRDRNESSGDSLPQASSQTQTENGPEIPSFRNLLLFGLQFRNPTCPSTQTRETHNFTRMRSVSIVPSCPLTQGSYHDAHLVKERKTLQDNTEADTSEASFLFFPLTRLPFRAFGDCCC